MATVSEIAKKKVLGVPVLYLAGGFVVILAIVAWQMKPSPELNPEADAANPSGNEEGVADAIASGDYSALKTTGTVVVQPQTPTPTAAIAETNETWARAAIQYLIDDKNVAPGDAQGAIHAYLRGDDLTIEQAGWRDAAIKKLKLPPEPLEMVGQTKAPAATPAQKQFSHFPGWHVVKGTNDNTTPLLATLYYGASRTGDGAEKITQLNRGYGPMGTTLATGTRVYIPAWVEPKFYTATKVNNTAAKIAKIYSPNVTEEQLYILNPGMTWPVKVGTRVRVL